MPIRAENCRSATSVVTATDGLMTVRTQSDASGYFNLKFRENVWPGQTVTLSFRQPRLRGLRRDVHPGIRSTTQKLYVAELAPTAPTLRQNQPKKHPIVSNIRIRYTVNSQGDTNIGSAVQTFQVVNQGNVPCNRQAPCSPDGLWKATTGSVTMDAGPDQSIAM